MTAAVIDSGTYKLEIDTGWDSSSFVLDSSTKGVLDNTTYTLGPGTTYADVTTGVLNLRIFRWPQHHHSCQFFGIDAGADFGNKLGLQ